MSAQEGHHVFRTTVLTSETEANKIRKKNAFEQSGVTTGPIASR